MSGAARRQVIHALPQDVVLQIAAGEIVSRPVNAVKEVLENSLDSGATRIAVYANELTKLSVVDNGSGIFKDDFPALCRRHHTSKLRTVEELPSIATFGFRGEGLAAISQVSFVTVASRTAESECAYQGVYELGELKGPVKPIAGQLGTSVTIENLFFNQREKRDYCAQRTGDELKRIEDMVSSYAVHYPGIAFTFKREKTSALVVNTPGGSNNATGVIGTIFGKHVAENLLPLSLNLPDLGIRIEGLVSNGNYNAPKTQMIFLVNNRLIGRNNAFRDKIKAAYDVAFQKNVHPFVYMEVYVDPENIDVNVHPGKETVRILRDTEAAESLKQRLTDMLRTWDESRRQVEHQLHQTLIAPASKKAKTTGRKSQSPTKTGASGTASSTVAVSKQMPPPPAELTRLTHPDDSVQSVLDCYVGDEILPELTQLMKTHRYIGVADPLHSIISTDLGLYVVNNVALARCCALQYVLSHVGSMPVQRFAQPLNVYKALLFGFESPQEGYCPESDGPIEDLAQSALETLYNEELMAFALQSFGIHFETINDALCLVGMPQHPFLTFIDLASIPSFLIGLIYDVNWAEQQSDAETIRQFALVLVNKYMIADSTLFAPRFVPVRSDAVGETRQAESDPIRSQNVMQAFQYASFGGAECMVWEKTLGVSASFFSQPAPTFYEHMIQTGSESERLFQALVHPGRPLKFFGFVQLSVMSRESRLVHVQKLHGMIARLWAVKAPGRNIERGWRLLATEDFSRCLIVNTLMRFSEVRHLNQFLNLLQTDFMASPIASEPFFKKSVAKEGAKVPVAFAAVGNSIFRPVEPVADAKAFFLECLPHWLCSDASQGEERFLPMAVDDRAKLIFQEWFALLKKDGYVLPASEEIRSTVIPIAQFTPKTN